MNIKGLSSLLGRSRAVGVDLGSGSIKVLMIEQSRPDVRIVGFGASGIPAGSDPRQLSQAIHTALAAAGADGHPVVGAVGSAEVVIRQVSLPPVARARILPALELQHRELGLLSPAEAILDAQILRRSKDGTANEILSASVPRALVDERMRVFQQAALSVSMLDVEPLALLNGALHLTALEAGELLVLLTLGRRSSVLSLFSESGPVVARYLDLGAEDFTERLRVTFNLAPHTVEAFAGSIQPEAVARAEAACTDLVARIAEDVRLSLTFYRTEYDRESLPRYAYGGWNELQLIPRWLAERLGLDGPLELMDPFKALEMRTQEAGPYAGAAGPQFLQAFGLALRGL